MTNIQAAAEITGSTAMDLVDRALYYMRLRSQTAPASLQDPRLVSSNR